MIIGFGNNVVSSLASDITASQIRIAVMPGMGKIFQKLLTTDISNDSISHNIYAKITLTDSQQSVYEICHLIGVSQDILTVVRGQEGTTAKGWSLNDVVANFATRGSEQHFV
ncbi:phage tail protein, partial [Yersinia enterocolitica]